MKIQQKSKQSGFTIIEVLIVLAIAGLIMLIVFLAVPALQRNSRNTQRRNDVAAYLGAVNEWSDNNSGKIPAVAADLTTANTGVNALARLGSLTAPTVVLTGVQAASTDLNAIKLVVQAVCSTTTNGATIAGSNRAYAVQYAVEGSSGTAISQCQDS